MRTANYIGRIGALAVTLGVGIAVAAAPGVAMAEAADSSDSTALMLGGTGIPTWNDADVEVIMDQFIAPTHPGQTIKPVAVTTPNELWPAGPWAAWSALRSVRQASGPGGSGWLLDDHAVVEIVGTVLRTVDQSVQAGVADLETAMAKHGNDDLVIYGYSQGAMVANREKRKLAEQYPGPEAPDIDFVLGGDPNLPNGGLLARFPGLYIPILDFSFNGPEPTDTQFNTTVITQQYDLFADFPLYPLNFIADLNALLGFFYVHLYPFDVSLADPSTPLPDTHGNTDYYFFETQDLPLFGPLRTLGVPESLIDVVEPFFRVIVELGYDRTIAPWEPTPARLIPTFNPVTLVADLVDAIGEGINNAAALTRFASAAEHSRGAAHHRAGRLGAGNDPQQSQPRRDRADDSVDVCRRATVGNADVDAGAQARAAVVADDFAGRRPFAADDGTAVEPGGYHERQGRHADQ